LRRATRGGPSRRRACPGACRAPSLAAVDDAAEAGVGGELGAAIALRDRAIVETAYAAGLRISELAAAELGSLDLRKGEIRVLGKGRKERIGLLGRPARAALEGYLADGRPVLAALRAVARRPDRIFLNHRGKALGVRGLRYRLELLRRLAGLRQRLAAHAAALVRDAPPRGGAPISGGQGCSATKSLATAGSRTSRRLGPHGLPGRPPRAARKPATSLRRPTRIVASIDPGE
jgi:integrase